MSHYIYRLLDSKREVLYVGRTNNIKTRINYHWDNGHLPTEVYDNVNEIEYLNLNSYADMLIAEVYFINKFHPKANVINKYESEEKISNIAWLDDALWEAYSNSDNDNSKQSLRSKEADLEGILEKYDIYLNVIASPDFEYCYPEAYRVLGKYKKEILMIIGMFKNNRYVYKDGRNRILSWVSVRTISETLYGDGNKYAKISRLLNLLVYTGWLRKLPEEEIPNSILQNLKRSKAKNKRSKRSNVYELIDLGDDFPSELNSICKDMTRTGFTLRTFNRNYVLSAQGEEGTNEMYVQDNGSTSSIPQERFDYIKGRILEEVDSKGYIIEKDFIGEEGGNTEEVRLDTVYRSILPHLIDGYDLQRKRLTKTLKQELGIHHLPAQSSPTILYKKFQ